MKKWKFNAFDITVLIVLVAAILVVGVRFSKANVERSGQTSSYEISGVIRSIRETSANQIQVGDSIYQSENDGYVGTVTEVNVKPAEEIVYKTDGSAVMAQKPERYDVYVKIAVDGIEMTDGYYTQNMTALSRGTWLPIRSKNIACTVIVEEITPTE